MFTTKPFLNMKKTVAGVALLAAAAGLGGCYYGPGYGPRYAYAAPAYAQSAYVYGPGYYAPSYGYAPYGGNVSLSFGGGYRHHGW